MTNRPLDTSVYLLNTDRNTTTLLNALTEEFKANKYSVETRSNSLGVLTMKPRKFLIPREQDSTPAEQLVQIRQEGGSVKVSMAYRCEDATSKTMGPCFQEDGDATAKISRIEKALLELFNRHLYKKQTDKLINSKNID